MWSVHLYQTTESGCDTAKSFALFCAGPSGICRTMIDDDNNDNNDDDDDDDNNNNNIMITMKYLLSANI